MHNGAHVETITCKCLSASTGTACTQRAGTCVYHMNEIQTWQWASMMALNTTYALETH